MGVSASLPRYYDGDLGASPPTEPYVDYVNASPRSRRGQRRDVQQRERIRNDYAALDRYRHGLSANGETLTVREPGINMMQLMTRADLSRLRHIVVQNHVYAADRFVMPRDLQTLHEDRRGNLIRDTAMQFHALSLQTLRLYQCTMSGSLAIKLSTSLITLHIDNWHSHCLSFTAALRNHPSLTSVSLVDQTVPYAQFDARLTYSLSSMPELTRLALHGALHSQTYSALFRLPNVKDLTLASAPGTSNIITDAAASSLSDNQTLTALRLAMPLSTLSLGRIAQHAKVSELEIEAVVLGGAAFAQLAAMPHLSRLTICPGDSTAEQMHALLRTGRLSNLRLTSKSLSGPGALDVLATSLTVRTLALPNINTVAVADLLALARNPHLLALEIPDYQLSAAEHSRVRAMWIETGHGAQTLTQAHRPHHLVRSAFLDAVETL